MTVGTVFERSKMPLDKWLLATVLMSSSKKGHSAHQLHRTIGVTYLTAWFMLHRIREAMRDDAPVSFGSGGGVVETFIGRNATIRPVGEKKGRGFNHKYEILALVDRESGKARSIVVDDLKREFADHDFVSHGAGECGRVVHANTIEAYLRFKARMKGTYRHCGRQHLHRHASELECRYDQRPANGIDVTASALAILKGAEGKCLTYRRPDARAIA